MKTCIIKTLIETNIKFVLLGRAAHWVFPHNDLVERYSMYIYDK